MFAVNTMALGQVLLENFGFAVTFIPPVLHIHPSITNTVIVVPLNSAHARTHTHTYTKTTTKQQLSIYGNSLLCSNKNTVEEIFKAVMRAVHDTHLILVNFVAVIILT
jgi:hypothetical protein